jgi:uncharacterized protein (DUF433 family)
MFSHSPIATPLAADTTSEAMGILSCVKVLLQLTASWYISPNMKTSPRRLAKTDLRELPAYSIPEAAHYLRLPVATLRAWAVGRPYRRADGSQFSKPVLTLPNPGRSVLSFINLVEAHVLGAIRRRYHIPFLKVRGAVLFLTNQLKTMHPLADHEFTTDGINLFIEHVGSFINVTADGQLAMRELLEVYLRRIERDPSGIPVKLFPFTREPETDEPRAIVIDPHLSFGRPVLVGTGVPTVIIAERYKAGETIGELAADYGRSTSDIEEAIRCELEVSARAA